MVSHQRKKTGLRGTGINQADGLYLPYTEEQRPCGPRGGRVSVMAYWGIGYPTWQGAKDALHRGREKALAEPGLDAVPVDTKTGKRLNTGQNGANNGHS